MIKNLKIWRHKRQARNAYIGYNSVCSEYDCSSILTRSYSKRATSHANQFNSAMRSLKQLGEKVPDIKL